VPVDPEADLTAATEKGPAIENTVRYVVLIGAVSVSIVACGGLLGGRTGAVLGIDLGVIVAGGSWWFSDRLVIRACGAQLSHTPTTSAMLVELSRRAAMSPPRLYVAPNPQPNAFAIGRTPSRASIVVNEGLLSLLEPAEVRAVLAHELAHIRRRDTLVTSMAGATASGVLGAVALLRRSRPPGTARNEEGPGIVLTSSMRALARLLRFALPSDRESGADRGGSDLTGDPEALARALTRMEGYAHVVPMEAILAQLSAWVVNPLGDRADTAWLFSTDSPVAKRIDRLRTTPGPRVVT
jgi:heat shock protein HtpX